MLRGGYYVIHVLSTTKRHRMQVVHDSGYVVVSSYCKLSRLVPTRVRKID
jgi:hypothetical protein